jgi:hypothetical protein
MRTRIGTSTFAAVAYSDPASGGKTPGVPSPFAMWHVTHRW